MSDQKKEAKDAPRLTRVQEEIMTTAASTGVRLLLVERGAVQCGAALITPVSAQDVEGLQQMGFVRALPPSRRGYAVTEEGLLWGAKRINEEARQKDGEDGTRS